MPHVFQTETKHTANVPLTPTKAARVIVAICNRNDTNNIIGDRADVEMGYSIPVTQVTMSIILGEALGLGFQDTMANPALQEYFALVCDKLYEVNITLAFSRTHWFITKLPNEHDLGYAYGSEDLVEQGPDGFRGFNW